METAPSPPAGETGPYQVIARRYRPRRFDEVVGQEATAETLRNAIIHERLAHAYLFCGPRGVGKTSMARIFARALNCTRSFDRERPRDERGVPCNDCEICRAIHIGDDIDVLELDGASHRGIEDVRDIIENVQFAPSRAPYKVYIVDEVHMLTREAFNALLKVLEEPPSHVKFIFATTEAHKIPDTVLSRCQRFDFHPIGEEATVRRLAQICAQENVMPEDGLLELIARSGHGGLRDAQTLLDQLISFSDEALRVEDLNRITGRVSESELDALVAAVHESRPTEVVERLDGCFASGTDPAVLLEQIIERLRELLKQRLRAAGTAGGDADRSGADPSGGALIDRLVGSLQILHETAVRLKGSPYPELALELALVKLARLEDPRTIDEALELLRRIEGASAATAPSRKPRQAPASARPPRTRSDAPSRSTPASDPVSAPVSSSSSSSSSSSESESESESASESVSASVSESPSSTSTPATPSPEAPPADFSHLRSLWSQIVIEFGERHPELQAFLRNAEIAEAGAGAVAVRFERPFHLRQMKSKRRVAVLESLIAEITGARWTVRTEHRQTNGGNGGPDGGGADGGSPGGGSADPERGAGHRGEGGEARPRAPESSGKLRDDPVVKKTRDLFRGKFV